MSSPSVPHNQPVTAVSLKNPPIAGILAFLVPGLGHWYQGRRFKAVLYCLCILGTFFTGLRIGHGQVVYFQWEDPENRTYAYLCQVWTGLPALPALAQAKLRSAQAFEEDFVPASLSGRFLGTIDGVDGELRGELTITRGGDDRPRRREMRFSGKLVTSAGETPVEGEIAGGSLGPQVAPSARRGVTGYFEGKQTAVGASNATPLVGRVVGSIPRPVWDWYGAPLRDSDGGRGSSLDVAHRQLGSRFELGVVYTMIAGLLNVLAIFDAVHGPAYGDEEESSTPSGPQPVPPPHDEPR